MFSFVKVNGYLLFRYSEAMISKFTTEAKSFFFFHHLIKYSHLYYTPMSPEGITGQQKTSLWPSFIFELLTLGHINSSCQVSWSSIKQSSSIRHSHWTQNYRSLWLFFVWMWKNRVILFHYPTLSCLPLSISNSPHGIKHNQWTMIYRTKWPFFFKSKFGRTT